MSEGKKRFKILIIDDSEVVLEVTKAALLAAGHEVITHDRAAGSVARILQDKPDLVLIDVNMPHLGGEVIVRMLATARPGDETIVLLYSSLPKAVLAEKVQATGAQGFIQKSSNMSQLVRDVNHCLRRLKGQP